MADVGTGQLKRMKTLYIYIVFLKRNQQTSSNVLGKTKKKLLNSKKKLNFLSYL